MPRCMGSEVLKIFLAELCSAVPWQDRLVQLAFAATLWLPRAQRSLLWQIFPIVLLHLVHPSDSVFAVCTPSFCTALSGALRVLFAELRTFSVFSSLDRSLSVLRAGVGAASGALSLEASLNGALAVALAIPLQEPCPFFVEVLRRQGRMPISCPSNPFTLNALNDVEGVPFGDAACHAGFSRRTVPELQEECRDAAFRYS